MKIRFGLALLALAALLPACGGDDGASGEPVAVQFAAMVGTEAFACGQTYMNVGNPSSDFTAQDLRFYVHDVRLVDDGGNEVPVDVDDDGKWQRDGVALIDLETGRPGCDAGSAETHEAIEGRAPAGTYTGLRFKLGLPFEMNHFDAAVQDPPLNVTSMFWNWLGGYKFLRVDGSTTELPGFHVHLGSTACDGANVMAPATACANENVSEIELTGFDPSANTVIVDLAGLFDGVDMTTNTMDTAAGCQSAPDDPDCEPVFHNIGLPWAGTPSSGQKLFRVQ